MNLALDPRADPVRLRFQIIPGLEVEPELRRNAEVAAQTQRGVRRDGPLAMDNLINAPGRHTELLRQPVRDGNSRERVGAERLRVPAGAGSRAAPGPTDTSVPSRAQTPKDARQEVVAETVRDDYLAVFDAVVPIGLDAACLVADLSAAASARLPLVDSLIAAAACLSGATIVHRDAHFAAIPAKRLYQLAVA